MNAEEAVAILTSLGLRVRFVDTVDDFIVGGRGTEMTPGGTEIYLDPFTIWRTQAGWSIRLSGPGKGCNDLPADSLGDAVRLVAECYGLPSSDGP